MTPNENLARNDPYRRVGTILLNKFRLEKYIASGGMGAVYFAVDIETNENFAVKLLKPDLLSKNPDYAMLFSREVASIQKFDHPNIVKVIAHGSTEDDIPFMVMEWLSGNILEDVLNQGQLDVDKISGLFEQVCNAISYAHGNNVLHLDIKPANIFLIKNEDNVEIVKVIDFGLSRILSSDSGTTVTRFLGSLQYCSPEHFGGKFTFQSDIYSLGVTLFHLITGLIPVGQSHIVAKQISGREIPSLPSVLSSNPNLPASIDDIIRKATQRDPADRYNSVLQFRDDFHRALKDVTTEDESDTLILPLEKRILRKYSRIFLLTVGSLILLVPLSYYLNFYFIQKGGSGATVLTPMQEGSTIDAPKQTIAVIFYDTSGSITGNQRLKNEENLISVVRSLPEQTKLRVYPINENIDNSPIYISETKRHSSEQFLRDNQKLQSIVAEIQKKPVPPRQSCILATINTTKRALRDYDRYSYNFEIIYISDMLEACTPPDRPMSEYAKRFECGSERLPVVPNLTFIISPSLSSYPKTPIDELEEYWRTIFDKCLYNATGSSFYFDTVPPERFRN